MVYALAESKEMFLGWRITKWDGDRENFQMGNLGSSERRADSHAP
jgi:hypothetical protein